MPLTTDRPSAQTLRTATPAPCGLPTEEVAERLAVYLSGMPADVRDSALMAYRGVTVALMTRRGIGTAEAEERMDRIMGLIRSRLVAIERAGGGVPGRA
ncbi:hypothetical protein M2352_001048 [Azospirillum fermentarium]|uniref:hypothetical protein n=1 Tax=Azospirillum fermentarium TaxID=1233114 RepID=UPI0022269ABC|nr:hypothetical protein [Azospirillum fermentarium]MCW2245457.1 hypothetical protein [Azospirillum fermentarium]